MVIPITVPEKTIGGLYIPGTAKDKPLLGTIVAYGDPKETGEEWEGKWPPFKVGTRVVYGRFAGEDLRLEDVGEESWPKIMQIHELLGILED